MVRPLMRYGIGQLEEMFGEGKADTTMLKQLEHELRYRQVPRAIALLTKVQAALHDKTAVPQEPTESAIFSRRAAELNSQQPELWGLPATPHDVSPPVPVRTVTRAVSPPEPQPVDASPAPSPYISLEEAYKILNATRGTAWQAIEQTRHTLVNQSHPSRLKALSVEKRAQALAEAKRVNAAYATLSQTRCG